MAGFSIAGVNQAFIDAHNASAHLIPSHLGKDFAEMLGNQFKQLTSHLSIVPDHKGSSISGGVRVEQVAAQAINTAIDYLQGHHR